MKKLALAVIATAFIAIGHTPVSAQTEDPTNPVPPALAVECGESDVRVDVDPADGIDDRCTNFYISVGNQPPPPVPLAPVPPLGQSFVPPAAVSPVSQASQPLPSTGSSVSPLLAMGAALFVGGGIIVVGTRRRSTAPAI